MATKIDKPKRLTPPPIKEKIVNFDYTPTDIFIRYLMSIQQGTEKGVHVSDKTKSEVASLWLQVNTNKANADQAMQDAAQASQDAAKALSDVTQVETDLTNLQTKVTKIDSDITTIKADITKIESDITTIQANIAKIKQDIIALQDKLDDSPQDGKNYVRNNGQWVALP